jgi:hypothetical protein
MMEGGLLEDVIGFPIETRLVVATTLMVWSILVVQLVNLVNTILQNNNE